MEIKEFNGSGYQPLIAYNGWRVAIVNTNDSNTERIFWKGAEE